jgi:hypothetical protein
MCVKPDIGRVGGISEKKEKEKKMFYFSEK